MTTCLFFPSLSSCFLQKVNRERDIKRMNRKKHKERKKEEREREKTTGILIVSCLSCDVMILYRQKTL
jgi:hypothetical protein